MISAAYSSVTSCFGCTVCCDMCRTRCSCSPTRCCRTTPRTQATRCDATGRWSTLHVDGTASNSAAWCRHKCSAAATGCCTSCSSSSTSTRHSTWSSATTTGPTTGPGHASHSTTAACTSRTWSTCCSWTCCHAWHSPTISTYRSTTSLFHHLDGKISLIISSICVANYQ